jgi:hypothetical protein
VHTAFAVLSWLLAKRFQARTLGLVRVEFHIATAIALSLIGISIAMREFCWPCLVYCSTQVFLYMVLAMPKRERALGTTLALVMALGATGVMYFPDTRFEVVAALGRPEEEESKDWIKVGQPIDPSLGFEGEVALLIWTECLDCARLAAVSALPKFLEQYPDAMVWTLTDNYDLLPETIKFRAVRATDYMQQGFGVARDDPPVFVIVNENTVARVGRLMEWQ